MNNEEIVSKFYLILNYVRFQVDSSCGEILDGEITLQDIEELKDVIDCVVRDH